MTEPPLATQPMPPRLHRAATTLDAVLAADPDVETRLAVGAAPATLNDVHPPYPPRDETHRSLPPDEGIALALTELAAAIAEAPSVGEAIRAGLAARKLRTLGGPP